MHLKKEREKTLKVAKSRGRVADPYSFDTDPHPDTAF